MHHNEDVFPDSYAFIPERWLDEQGLRRPNMDMGLLSFSKGSRQCLGIKYAQPRWFLNFSYLLILQSCVLRAICDHCGSGSARVPAHEIIRDSCGGRQIRSRSHHCATEEGQQRSSCNDVSIN
jgi:hypothetical protein